MTLGIKICIMKVKSKWVLPICIIIVGIVAWFVTKTGDNLKQQIIEMQGKRISLDFMNARSVINGRDSLFKNVSKPKLIVFVDSTSCTSCFLSQLINYYEINDSLKSHNREMIVVLHPQKARIPEIELRLNNETYPFWCILDRNGEFVKQNLDISANPLLHTFLIDEYGQVVLVGDPVKNKKIKNLLLKMK